MKELTLVLENDELYTALEAAAIKSGCSLQEIAQDALEQWLLDAELDELEWKEIEESRREWRQNGGMDAEEFFTSLRQERFVSAAIPDHYFASGSTPNSALAWTHRRSHRAGDCGN